MATPFSHTLQALVADSLRGSRLGLAGIVLVLSIWLVWFVFAEVGIYKTAPAQLQAELDIHSVEAGTAGRVVASHMAVGREVRVGDILVELENTAVRLKLAEHTARLDSARAQLRTLRAEINAQEQALADMREATPLMRDETQLRYEQAQSAAQLAQAELARWRTLREGSFVTDLQVIERETTARRLRSEAEELHLALSRQKLDRRSGEADRHAGIERLRREAAQLAGLVATTAEVVQQIEHEGRSYVLRAPVNGPLADVAELRPGMMVRSGERLATILPGGELKIMADFPPNAIGHLRPGQAATLRLAGFPAEQYGRVTAAVQRVAQEPRSDKIRVELAIAARPPSIPLQHGLLGAVEIEVERISPAVLVLRTAGALLHDARAGETP